MCVVVRSSVLGQVVSYEGNPYLVVRVMNKQNRVVMLWRPNSTIKVTLDQVVKLNKARLVIKLDNNIMYCRVKQGWLSLASRKIIVSKHLLAQCRA